MEAFVKESARMTPIDGVGCRRKVITPVEFSNGPRVEPGDWVSVPQEAMWRDEERFAEPDRFDPMRFLKHANTTDQRADSASSEINSELTEVSPTWVLWGYGRTAW